MKKTKFILLSGVLGLSAAIIALFGSCQVHSGSCHVFFETEKRRLSVFVTSYDTKGPIIAENF